MADNDNIVVVETVDDLIQLFGTPRDDEYALNAVIEWLNTPQDHELDEET